jgi:hypothetical protein
MKHKPNFFHFFVMKKQRKKQGLSGPGKTHNFARWGFRSFSPEFGSGAPANPTFCVEFSNPGKDFFVWSMVLAFVFNGEKPCFWV